jgi:hypothetical protein
MFEKKDPAETQTQAPTTDDPHMTRSEFIQSLHHSIDAYAEMWDQGHVDKKTPEPTTLSAWRKDFTKFLEHPAA